MKKKLSLILAILTIAAVASLTACSGNSQPSESSEAPQSSSESSTVESSADNSDNDSSETSADSSSENTSSDDSSADDTSSNDSSADDTSSDDSSIDGTSSSDRSADDTSSDTEPVAPSEKGDAVAKAAYDMLDKPFTDGGYTPETGFDNSGLIYYALTSAGIECPRGLTAQKDMGKEIKLSELQKGDIVFIKDGESFFGGIYTGDDTMVFSPYPGQKVRTADLKSIYYIDNFLKAVRVS